MQKYATFTSLIIHRRTCATLSVTDIVWYTKLDAHCDKPATAVGRLLTTLMTVNVLWQNFSKSTV